MANTDRVKLSPPSPERLELSTQDLCNLLEQRRKSAEAALWQLPGVSLAAQAFLLGAGLDPDARPGAQVVVGGLGILAVVATAFVVLYQALRATTMTGDELAAHDFFARFWAEPDRIRVWLDDPDPPGERSADVARRFFTFARSLYDIRESSPRHFVCVTHSGPLRALLREYVLDHDPGEPEYVETVQLTLSQSDPPAWRFRDIVTASA